MYGHTLREHGAMRFRSRPGGRRGLEKRAREAEERAEGLQAALEELTDCGEGLSAELLAAASMAGPDGQAVKTVIDGHEVIAVVGNEGGSAREWQAAIRRGLGRRIAS